MVEAGLIASRWLHYVAVTVLLGLALFRLYAARSALAGAKPARQVLTASAALALISGLSWFFFATAVMAGGLADAPATIATVLFGTMFGPVWASRLVVALILCGVSLRPGRWAPAILAGLLLASLALTGHARMHEGAMGWLHAGADAIHLVAAGAWLGALAAFVLLLRLAPNEPQTGKALSDFSLVGSLAVATLVITGVANAWLVLGGVGPLFATLYGRLLMLKVGLFAMMVVLAGLNRFQLVPTLASSAGPALRRMRFHVLAEQTLGLAVLLVVSALGTLDPAA